MRPAAIEALAGVSDATARPVCRPCPSRAKTSVETLTKASALESLSTVTFSATTLDAVLTRGRGQKRAPLAHWTGDVFVSHTLR